MCLYCLKGINKKQFMIEKTGILFNRTYTAVFEFKNIKFLLKIRNLGRMIVNEHFSALSLLLEMFQEPGDLRMSLFSTKERTPSFSDL